MLHQQLDRAAVIVTLPAEIDLTNQERAYEQLYAAIASGARVVIADLTATKFCDCSSVRGLLRIQQRFASRHAQLRLMISPGTAVSRVVELMGLDRLLPIHVSSGEAAA